MKPIGSCHNADCKAQHPDCECNSCARDWNKVIDGRYHQCCESKGLYKAHCEIACCTEYKEER